MAWSLLIALLAMAPDSGASRLAVAPLRGKGGAACAERLSELFAARVQVVPLDAGYEGLTNWDELAEWLEENGAPGAEFVVVGSLNNTSIVLEAYTTHDKRLVGLKSVDTVGRCKLSEEATQLLISWIGSLLPQGSTPPPPSLPPPSAGEDAKVEAPSSDEKTIEQKSEVEPERKPFAIAIRGAVAIGRRDLKFEGAATPNLRAYQVDVMPVPELSLEAYPLANTGVWEYLRPLGLSAHFARSVGLSSARIEGGPKLDTIHTEVGAALLYRWRVPLSSLRFDLIPQIGYHYLGFGLRSSAGATEPDLPDVAYSSVSFGIGADVPVLDRVKLFGSGAYLAVLGGGQIFSPGYFEEGTARGYRVEIGMAYEIIEGLLIELAGHHLAYSLSLNPKPDGERIAQSAADTVSGIGLGLRIEL